MQKSTKHNRDLLTQRITIRNCRIRITKDGLYSSDHYNETETVTDDFDREVEIGGSFVWEQQERTIGLIDLDNGTITYPSGEVLQGKVINDPLIIYGLVNELVGYKTI